MEGSNTKYLLGIPDTKTSYMFGKKYWKNFINVWQA